MATEKRLWVWY